jgi:hypothetical protein
MTAVGERWSGILSSWTAAGQVDVPLPPLPLPPAPEPEDDAEADADAAADASAGAGSAAAVAAAGASAGGTVPPGDPATWLVLGIESSCDDTGAAIVRGDGVVLGEVLASQAGGARCERATLLDTRATPLDTRAPPPPPLPPWRCVCMCMHAPLLSWRSCCRWSGLLS